MPEFVTGIVLIIVARHLARAALPITATVAGRRRAADADPATCSCRRSASTLVLFGYIARITRAGMIEALDADYTRTAFLKGLSARP